jgi:hypothetical protein
MNQLLEGLKSGDLKDLVHPVFEVDSYKSKMGNDEDIVVLAFEVTGKQPAKDFVEFTEKGYDFVLDADVSSGEVERDTYKVFVEIERSIKITRQVQEFLYGLSELTGIENWAFRYYKNYKTQPLNDFGTTVPTSAEIYRQKMGTIFEDEMRFFFRKSPLDYILIEDGILKIKRSFNSPVKLKLIEHGTRTDVLTKLAGNIRVDESAMAETTWLTKYFGNYNITKYGDYFVFENENTVLVLDLIK